MWYTPARTTSLYPHVLKCLIPLIPRRFTNTDNVSIYYKTAAFHSSFVMSLSLLCILTKSNISSCDLRLTPASPLSQQMVGGKVKKPGKRGRKPAKIDLKAKLERSRQSARECRARKKLRYQYLEELVSSKERAICALREELEMVGFSHSPCSVTKPK